MRDVNRSISRRQMTGPHAIQEWIPQWLDLCRKSATS